MFAKRASAADIDASMQPLYRRWDHTTEDRVHSIVLASHPPSGHVLAQ
jgi:hypothetical protein